MARSRDWDDDNEDDRPARRRRPRDEDEDEDRPRKRSRSGGSNGMAVTALVLGILSLFCSFVTGIPAVIFGFLGLAKAKQTGTGKGMAITGIMMGIGGMILTGIAGYMIYVGVKKGVNEIASAMDKASGDFKSTKDLKDISLAANRIHDFNGRYPLSYHVAANGVAPPTDPTTRLSWRVSILPQLNQSQMFQQFQGDQAWNSPVNKPLSDSIISTYAESPGSLQTRYRVFVGPGAMFEAESPAGKGNPVARPPNAVTITGVSDGTSNTIFCVEAGETVPWAQHRELTFNPTGPLPSLGRPGADMFLVVMVDSSVRAVRKTVDPKVLRGAITRAGAEVVFLD